MRPGSAVGQHPVIECLWRMKEIVLAGIYGKGCYVTPACINLHFLIIGSSDRCGFRGSPAFAAFCAWHEQYHDRRSRKPRDTQARMRADSKQRASARNLSLPQVGLSQSGGYQVDGWQSWPCINDVTVCHPGMLCAQNANTDRNQIYIVSVANTNTRMQA